MTRQYDRDKVITALDLIDSELSDVKSQPIKVTREIGHEIYCSIMPAFTKDGVVGCKIITWDENTGKSSAVLVSVKDQGRIETLHSIDLTPIRCSLMVAATIRQTFPLGSKLILGIVGYGKIGRQVEATLSNLYGLTVRVLESKRKNPNATTDILKDCDVIVTATSTRKDDKPLEACDYDFYFNEFSRVDYNFEKTKLFISLDGGYMLGRSFREVYRSKSDYPAQLLKSFDMEFPFDDEIPTIEDFPTKIEEPHCVYLYGMGVADLITERLINDTL